MKRPEALLSFSLPGLGQLAQKRHLASLFFFFTFAVVVAVAKNGWLVPLVCLLAGADTLRFPPASFESPKLRGSYGAVGGLGFLCWFSLSVSYFLPVRLQSTLNADVDRMRTDYFACRRVGAESDAAALVCLESGPSGRLSDPWGSPYERSLSDGIFLIRSRGPDRQPGTSDDLVYRSFLKGGQE